MAARHILAIDQGTTSTRAIVFDARAGRVASAQQELPQIFPKPGWVEHDPEEIWRATVGGLPRGAGQSELDAAALAGIGITNQRETTVVWDRSTGKPIHNAIVWQDRRTADALPRAGGGRARRRGRGARPACCSIRISPAPRSPGCSTTWPARAAAAESGELAFGTIDSFLLWRLTGGKVHATDATNASRTLLFDIHTGAWDAELLTLFGVPRAAAAGGARLRAATSASPTADICSARRCRSPAWRATSRRRPSARPASSPA